LTTRQQIDRPLCLSGCHCLAGSPDPLPGNIDQTAGQSLPVVAGRLLMKRITAGVVGSWPLEGSAARPGAVTACCWASPGGGLQVPVRPTICCIWSIDNMTTNN